MKGTITKGIGGFYYVAGEDGNTYECKARGIFRLDGVTPLAGDRVELGISPEGQATVDAILPRLNSFDRPPCANVELLVLVIAAKDPAPSFPLIDRFIVAAEQTGAKVILCVNKTDLAEAPELQVFTDLYGKYYSVYFVEARSGKGVAELRAALRGKQAALAGASGTGKSTLTNLLIGAGSSQAGEISSRTLRGKNTTRHTELFAGDGFYLFDTPGFTSFDTADMEESELALYFPEFEPYLHRCGFSDCTHIAEKSCAVRQAVRDGLVSKQRYRSFKEMYLELKERNSY